MEYKKRQEFLKSKEWKDFRQKIADRDVVDYITQSKLRKGFNVHHLSQNKDEYSDLNNEKNFISLNKKTHELLHFIYEYYKKDKDILNRLKEILDLMLELNS